MYVWFNVEAQKKVAYFFKTKVCGSINNYVHNKKQLCQEVEDRYIFVHVSVTKIW